MRKRKTKVRLISCFFIFISVWIFAVLVFYIIGFKKISSRKNFFLKQKNFIHAAKFKTFNTCSKNVNLKSDKIYETKDNDKYVFENMTSTFEMPNGNKGVISADLTKVDKKNTSICEFIGNVNLTTESGLLMKTDRSFADLDKKTVHGDSGVTISLNDMKVSAKKYFINMNSNIITLENDANGFLKLDQITSERLIIHFDQCEKNSNVKKLEAIGNAVYISENCTLKAKKNISYIENNLNAYDKVEMIYKKDGDYYIIKSDSMMAQIDSNGKISDVQASSHLVINTQNTVIQADRGILKDNKIKVFDNVVISDKDGNIFGNEAVLDMETKNIFVNKLSGAIDDGIAK